MDEFFPRRVEEGQRGGRKRGKKALGGVAIEVRGRGSGRVRLPVRKALLAGVRLPGRKLSYLEHFRHAYRQPFEVHSRERQFISTGREFHAMHDNRPT